MRRVEYKHWGIGWSNSGGTPALPSLHGSIGDTFKHIALSFTGVI